MDFTGLIPNNFTQATTAGIVNLVSSLSQPLFLMVSIIGTAILIDIFLHRK
jgi:hypothetical protein